MGLFSKVLGGIGENDGRVVPEKNLAGAEDAGKNAILNAAEEAKAIQETAKEAVKAAEPVETLSEAELKELSDRILATAALSMYCAACDGNISVEEYMEMDINIGSLKGKHKLPAEVNAELDKISADHNITWETVTSYLDRIEPDELMKMSDDIADIMVASDGVNEAEQKCVDQFAKYVRSRV
ncbi:MAG: hypothetical protein IKQ63_04430 [Eubacterium sp.]|nr:hypothetical protein [Eubacterium sp.]